MTEVDATSAALNAIIDARVAPLRYRGVFEYIVVSQSGNAVSAKPSRGLEWLPPIDRARLVFSPLGGAVDLPTGSFVLVSFINGDETRPVVIGLTAGTPDEITLSQRSRAAVEHATSAEALVHFLKNWFEAFAHLLHNAPGPGSPGSAPITTANDLATLIDTFQTADLMALDAIVRDSTSSISAPLYAGIVAALASKSADADGKSPNLGSPDIRIG